VIQGVVIPEHPQSGIDRHLEKAEEPADNKHVEIVVDHADVIFFGPVLDSVKKPGDGGVVEHGHTVALYCQGTRGLYQCGFAAAKGLAVGRGTVKGRAVREKTDTLIRHDLPPP
jgi:hypothetical protein